MCRENIRELFNFWDRASPVSSLLLFVGEKLFDAANLIQEEEREKYQEEYSLVTDIDVHV